jgi:hypothetical protein
VAELSPPLTTELVHYVEHAASILIGTCDAALVPDCVRGVGVRVAADRRHLTVLVPTAIAGHALANLRGNPRLAVTTAALPTFGTVQVKGVVTAIRDAGDADRALALAYQDRFADELSWAGREVTRARRIAVWPCTALDLAITTIYTAVPDPLADGAASSR